MTHSSQQGLRKSLFTALLSPFLHPDVIPLVLGYEATIQFELQWRFGTQRGDRSGELDNPYGCVALTLTRLDSKTGGAEDELVVVDSANGRIQVFHQRTGRFLRQWGRKGWKNGEFRFPITAVMRLGTEKGPRHQELFVRDVSRDDVQIFRLSDGQFLRGFQTENGGSYASSGIAISQEDIFVSQQNQIDVKTISEGKTIRRMDHIGCADNLFVDDEEHELFIASSDKNRVEVLDITSGQCLREYGAPLQSPMNREELDCPRGVVAHGDEVIVSDTSNHRVVVFDRSSCRMLRSIGVQDGFHYPFGLALNGHNQLFVCDTGNHRVLLFE